MFRGLQKRQEAFTSYKDYIGMDITSLVTLPVWIMEPFTILQRLAEIMEYTDQLDRAACTEDPYERWFYLQQCSCSFNQRLSRGVHQSAGPRRHPTTPAGFLSRFV